MRIPVLQRFRRLWLAGLLAASMALGMSFLLAGVASAHSAYDHSDPAAGAVLASAPTQVAVFFKENVNPQGSSLVIYHSTSKNTLSFDQEAKVVSQDKGTQFPLSNPKKLTIAMQGDGNGIYAVVWNTVSADDGDPDSGVFFFGVGTGNVLGNGSTSTTSTTSTTGTPVWVPILVGILALILGAGLGLGLVGRRAKTAGSVSQPTALPDAEPQAKEPKAKR